MKHVLIVDDEAPIREILSQMLTQSGFRVTEAAAAHEALGKLESDPPDLLISDLQLEESDGLSMISEMRAKRPSLPVILLTGILFDEEVVRDSISKLVTAYLPKTAPLARVLEEVRRLTA
jgi:two-component system response regulator GlrR